MSHEVDARGLACPQPVINTKKVLDSLECGVVTVLVDNAAAKENVTRLARSNGCGVLIEEQEGCYRLTITKEKAERTAQNSDAQQPVYLMTKNTLGQGSDELGEVLIKSFFFTLLAGDSLPSAVMFINSGVKLTTAGSPVLEHLQGLSSRGVKIMSCGTCLDYFGLKDELGVGEISNMYAILEQLNAGKAITL